MKARKLAADQLASDPSRLWNEFISILAHSSYEELSDAQRMPCLVFWYESEVQNGGHLQYFLNRGTGHAHVTVQALHQMGAICQGQLLEEALGRFASRKRNAPYTPHEFVQEARRGEFEDLDKNFLGCSPGLVQVLEQFLSKNQALFFEIV